MDERIQNVESPRSEPLPMQPHTCTAVIEVLVELTPESAWDEADS